VRVEQKPYSKDDREGRVPRDKFGFFSFLEILQGMGYSLGKIFAKCGEGQRTYRKVPICEKDD
jgi:hypothetical protein